MVCQAATTVYRMHNKQKYQLTNDLVFGKLHMKLIMELPTFN